MTSEQIASLLELAEASKTADAWLSLETHTLTLHAAFNGASLSLSRIQSLKLVGPLIYAKTSRGEIHVVRLEDVFAGSIEPSREKERKAGFV